MRGFGGTWFLLEIACLSISAEQGKQEFDEGHLKAWDGAVLSTVLCGPGSNQVASTPNVGLRGSSPCPLIFDPQIDKKW